MSQLTPDEIALVNHLRVKKLSAGEAIAALETPNTDSRLVNGVPYEEVPVAEPMPWLPVSDDIAWGLNDRVATFTNQTINQEATVNYGFDLPSVVYAITASVRDTAAGGAFPGNGFANSLDTFRVQFRLSQGRRWQTANVMGSAVCGTAQRPRFLGRPGWRLGQGATLICAVTPLVANLQIDIVLWAIETTGGSNIRPTA